MKRVIKYAISVLIVVAFLGLSTNLTREHTDLLGRRITTVWGDKFIISTSVKNQFPQPIYVDKIYDVSYSTWRPILTFEHEEYLDLGLELISRNGQVTAYKYGKFLIYKEEGDSRFEVASMNKYSEILSNIQCD